MSEERKTFCTECGTENSGNSKFCSNCGSKLEQVMPAADPVAAKAPVMDTPAESAVQEAPAAETFTETSATENVYAGANTPYTTGVPFENADSVTAEEPVAQKAADTEEIQINYAQDAGDFSGNAYSSEPQYYSAEPVVEKKGKQGFAIASMICGILSVLCCCFSCFSLVLAIAAIALGIVALACKYDGKGMAIAGIVLGGIGILFFIVIIIVGASDSYNSIMDELMNELY